MILYLALMLEHQQPQLFIQTHLCLHSTVHLYYSIFPCFLIAVLFVQRIALSLDKFHIETENKDDPAESDRMLDPCGNIPPIPPSVLERHLTFELTYFPVNNTAVNTTILFPANFML